MIYRESTTIGDVTINKNVLNSVIVQAIKPWVYTGKLKLLPNKTIKITDKGLYICLHFSVAFGESTVDIFKQVSSYIADSVINSLEMDLVDVVLYIDTMFTQKGHIAVRNIKYSYNANKN